MISEKLSSLLKKVKTIAIVGASSNPHRDSYKVMKFLIDSGYKVFPVNPTETNRMILNQKCYSNLNDIQEKIDMVDVFRAKDAVMRVTEEAIFIGAKVLWTQLGVINEEARELAINAGIKVIMNRCPKIELEKQY